MVDVYADLNVLESKINVAGYGSTWNVQWKEGNVVKAKTMDYAEAIAWVRQMKQDVYFQTHATTVAGSQQAPPSPPSYTPETDLGDEYYQLGVEAGVLPPKSEPIINVSPTGEIFYAYSSPAGKFTASLEVVAEKTGYSKAQLQEMATEVKMHEQMRTAYEGMVTTTPEKEVPALLPPVSEEGTYLIEQSAYVSPEMRRAEVRRDRSLFSDYESPSMIFGPVREEWKPSISVSGTLATLGSPFLAGAVSVPEVWVGTILEPFISPLVEEVTGQEYHYEPPTIKSSEFRAGEVVGLTWIALGPYSTIGAYEKAAAVEEAAIVSLEQSKLLEGGNIKYEGLAASTTRRVGPTGKGYTYQRGVQKSFAEMVPKVTEADDIIFDLTVSSFQLTDEGAVAGAKLLGTADETVGQVSGELIKFTKEGWKSEMISIKSEKVGGIGGLEDFRVSKGSLMREGPTLQKKGFPWKPKYETLIDEVPFMSATKKPLTKSPTPEMFDISRRVREPTGKFEDFSYLLPKEARATVSAAARTKVSSAERIAEQVIQSPISKVAEQPTSRFLQVAEETPLFMPVRPQQEISLMETGLIETQDVSKVGLQRFEVSQVQIPVQERTMEQPTFGLQKSFQISTLGQEPTRERERLVTPALKRGKIQVPETLVVQMDQQRVDQMVGQPQLFGKKMKTVSPVKPMVPMVPFTPPPPPPPSTGFPPLPLLGGGLPSMKFEPRTPTTAKSRWVPSLLGQLTERKVPRPKVLFTTGFEPRFEIVKMKEPKKKKKKKGGR